MAGSRGKLKQTTGPGRVEGGQRSSRTLAVRLLGRRSSSPSGAFAMGEASQHEWPGVPRADKCGGPLNQHRDIKFGGGDGGWGVWERHWGELCVKTG